MAGEVIHLRTRAKFVSSEPDQAETAVPAPQPPAGLTEEQQQIWWDGWTARHNYEERAAEAALVQATRFIQEQRVARGMRPLQPVS